MESTIAMDRAPTRLVTIAEVKKTLASLVLPVPDNIGLSALKRMEGDAFVNALMNPEAKAQGGRSNTQQRDYLESVLTAAHPLTLQMLESAGLRVDVTALIDLAKREGASFREAVRMIKQASESPDGLAAIAHLRGLLEEYDVPEIDYGIRYCEESLVKATSGVVMAGQKASQESAMPASTAQVGDVAAETAKQFGESFKVYAKTAALCISETQTRVGAKHTLTFEIAKSDGSKSYDWKEKTAVMLTVPEHVLVLGVLRGYLDCVELKGHGASREKSMTIRNQGDRFFITIVVRNQSPRAIPIMPGYAYPVYAMLIRQMQRNDPALTASHIDRIAKEFCIMQSKKVTSHE